MLDAAKQALVDGWQLSMWVGVVMAGAVFAFIALRGSRRAAIAAPAVQLELELEAA